MFCKQCGSELKNGAVFCTNCGAKQVAEVPQPAVEEETLEKTVGVFGDVPNSAAPINPPPMNDAQVAAPFGNQAPPSVAPTLAPQVQAVEPEMDKTVGVFNTIPPVGAPQPNPVTPPRPATPPQYTPPVQPAAPQYPQQVNYQNNQQQFVPANGASNGHVSFGKAIELYFKNYVNFTGRASRSEYWWAFLFEVLVMLVTLWIPVVGQLVTLALLLPSLSIAIRRLHDIGKAWYWYFMGLIPLAGFIIMIVLYCKESDGNNQWGPAVAPNGVPYNQQYTQQPAQPQYAQQPQQPPVKKQITDQDIVAMAQQHAPFDLNSPDAKHVMDNAIGKIVPTYSGIENLASAMMLCDPQEIKDKIAATDTDTLIVIFKALGYYIGIGGDQNVLGLVQQNVLTTLKTRF